LIEEMKIGLATKSFRDWFTHLSDDLNVIDGSEDTEFDIVVFTGGEDISPYLYGEEPDLCRYWSDDRDIREIAVLDSIYKSKTIVPKYVIGVCRGIQILNAYFGGTLYQDLGEKSHRGSHHIKYIEDVGVLSNMTIVNSMHHQAVKDLAPNAIPIAIEPTTGVIEMVNFNKYIPTWGTQFHPEAFQPERSRTFFNLLLETMEVQK